MRVIPILLSKIDSVVPRCQFIFYIQYTYVQRNSSTYNKEIRIIFPGNASLTECDTEMIRVDQSNKATTSSQNIIYIQTLMTYIWMDFRLHHTFFLYKKETKSEYWIEADRGDGFIMFENKWTSLISVLIYN